MTRPTALPVHVAGIPDRLKAERRWLNWLYALRNGRWAKIPCKTSGYHAKPNDPTTWTTFDDALAASSRFDGVGFCLGDGWAGIDLDNIQTHPLINRIRCYRETSPSGTGIKAIGRSQRIGGEIKFDVTPPAFTTWQGPRFFVITGHGQGDPTVDITDLLDELFPIRRVSLALGAVPSFIEGPAATFEPVYGALTDDQVVERILASPQAEKFIKLVRGDLSDYGQDHSRADQGFFGIVVYWTQGDLEQAERLFRQTKLMRPKWGGSYRRATLAKAVQS